MSVCLKPDTVILLYSRGCYRSSTLPLSSGIVYDRNALTSYVSSRHFGQARFPCPVSRKSIDRHELQNSTTLLIKQFIDDYIATNEQIGRGLIAEKRDIKPFICVAAGKNFN